MGGTLRPHPFLLGVQAVAAGLPSVPVPHLVPRVLGVVEYRPDRTRLPPIPTRRRDPFPVEIVGDSADALPPEHELGEDPLHRGSAIGIGLQQHLVFAPLRHGSRRVGKEAPAVSVGSYTARVEALSGVLLHPPLRLFHELQHVPLADCLLNPSGEDGGRTPRFAGFVRYVDEDARSTKLFLVGEGKDHAASEPLRLVGDHGIEAPVGATGLFEEGIDPDPIVAAARLDVGELADDPAETLDPLLAGCLLRGKGEQRLLQFVG
jgi:hypothetical protein